MKLSKRLKQIDQMVASNYDHIWDCCCDHGFLGASLLSRQAAPTIHFVDIVPGLMAVVESKLEKFYANSAAAWQTHCLDVAKLPLKQHQGKHLIIIAGVGGDLMVQFINDIHQKNPDITIEFLLCPVNNPFLLRQKLIALNFSLQREVLVEENRRFYEVILVSTISHENKKISPVGHDIWQANNIVEAKNVRQYLDKTLKHYSRIQQAGTHHVDHIISAYRNEVSL